MPIQSNNIIVISTTISQSDAFLSTATAKIPSSNAKLLQKGCQINLLILHPSSISLVCHSPLHLLVPQLPNQWLKHLFQIHFFAEEMVQPKVPTTSQHSIHIKEQELHHSCRNPPIHSMPTPHKIHHSIKHWQPLLQWHMVGLGQAAEALAIVILPNHRVFRQTGKRILRQRGRRGGGGPGEAPPPRKRVAAAENQGIGNRGIRRAESKWSVIHVLMKQIRVVLTSRSYRRHMSVEKKIGRDRNGRFPGRRRSRRLEAGEVVDGGAYGLELADEVVGDGGDIGGGGYGLDVGGEVVEREDVCGHHSHQEKHVQTHGETHHADKNFLDLICGHFPFTISFQHKLKLLLPLESFINIFSHLSSLTHSLLTNK
nr:hypothetical protein KK1_028632 [Ipomoea batatas]